MLHLPSIKLMITWEAIYKTGVLQVQTHACMNGQKHVRTHARAHRHRHTHTCCNIKGRVSPELFDNSSHVYM